MDTVCVSSGTISFQMVMFCLKKKETGVLPWQNHEMSYSVQISLIL